MKFNGDIKALIEFVEKQIKDLYKLLEYTRDERTVRMYCRMIVYRLDYKKALTKVVSA